MAKLKKNKDIIEFRYKLIDNYTNEKDTATKIKLKDLLAIYNQHFGIKYELG